MCSSQNFRGLWPLPEKDKKLSKDFYQVGEEQQQQQAALCISCHPLSEPPGVSVGAGCATPWMCWMFSCVLQRIQEWLKESGRSEHSLAAFQRNPSGPK